MGRDLIHGLVDLVGAVTLLLHHGLVLGGLTGVLWLLVPGAGTATRTGTAGAWVARHPRLAVRIGAGPAGCHGTATQVQARTVVPVIATASVAASGVHLAVAPLHRADGLLVVGFFVSVGLLQLAWAAAILLRPAPVVLGLGLALQVSVLAVWLVSRTVGVGGLPVEPVGAWDLSSSLWQVVAVVGVVYALRSGDGVEPVRPGRRSAYRWSTPAQLWASASLTVLVTLALEAT